MTIDNALARLRSAKDVLDPAARLGLLDAALEDVKGARKAALEVVTGEAPGQGSLFEGRVAADAPRFGSTAYTVPINANALPTPPVTVGKDGLVRTPADVAPAEDGAAAPAGFEEPDTEAEARRKHREQVEEPMVWSALREGSEGGEAVRTVKVVEDTGLTPQRVSAILAKFAKQGVADQPKRGFWKAVTAAVAAAPDAEPPDEQDDIPDAQVALAGIADEE